MLYKGGAGCGFAVSPGQQHGGCVPAELAQVTQPRLFLGTGSFQPQGVFWVFWAAFALSSLLLPLLFFTSVAVRAGNLRALGLWVKWGTHGIAERGIFSCQKHSKGAAGAAQGRAEGSGSLTDVLLSIRRALFSPRRAVLAQTHSPGCSFS